MNMAFGQTTSTFVGTPDYMAPEILMHEEYSKAVDWWSFGIFIFVMLTGRYPFYGTTNRELMEDIRAGISYPFDFERSTVSLLDSVY